MFEGKSSASIYAYQNEILSQLGKLSRFSARNVLIEIVASSIDKIVLDEIVRFIKEVNHRTPTYIGTYQEATLQDYSDIMSDGASVCAVSYINGIAMGHTPKIDFSASSPWGRLSPEKRIAQVEEELNRITRATRIKKIENLVIWPGCKQTLEGVNDLTTAVQALYPNTDTRVFDPGNYAHWLMRGRGGSSFVVQNLDNNTSYHNLKR